jgi:hypothetical protein
MSLYSRARYLCKNSSKAPISELIAAKLTGPENGALNTVPEVLFIPGGVILRK